MTATSGSTNPAPASVEPVAWQWRYVGEHTWRTPSGGTKLSEKEVANEQRLIEQRPLYAAAPITQPQGDADTTPVTNEEK